MRLRNAQASSSDNISAPRAGAKPRSLQNATTCTIGSAMATQQHTIDTQISPCTRLPGRPTMLVPDIGSRAAASGAAAGGRRISSTKGSMLANTNTPYQNKVVRQPQPSMVYWNSGGHTAPAICWPADTSARAAPRLRSNQRLTLAIKGAKNAALPNSPIINP